MKVPKNPQRPVEKRWSPPCLGWEFMSNSIRSSGEKMTLVTMLGSDYTWPTPTILHPTTRADGLKCKPKCVVSLLGAFQWLPSGYSESSSTSQVYLAKGPFLTWSQLLPLLLKPSISFQPNQVTHNLQKLFLEVLYKLFPLLNLFTRELLLFNF